ncbi:MAG: PepSY-associated TM helix domain-containing protein, partial [Bacteroidota bacterium]
FFAFAILTGVIVHWKKITSNFFTFRLKGSIKNLWTDSHTALGIIGLPFQFMYAVSGAFFGLVIVLFVPFMMVLFDGDQDKMLELFRGQKNTIEAPIIADAGKISINTLVDQTTAEFKASEIKYINVQLKDYKTADAELTVTTELNNTESFMAQTNTTYRLSDGAVIGHKPLDEYSYVDVAPATLGRLHFAQYGGYLIKAIYFIMALITCYVIMSGVMIWLTARDKKMYEHKASFNRNVGAIYAGASLGLFPAIALFFCMVKLFPLEMENRYDIMTPTFFLFWLAYIVYAYFIKSTYKINKHALYLAGVMGIFIPIFNGMQSGLWLWKSVQLGYTDSFLIDASWLVMGIVSILSAIYAKPVDPKKRIKKTPTEGESKARTRKTYSPTLKPKKPVKVRPVLPEMISKSSQIEPQ